MIIFKNKLLKSNPENLIRLATFINKWHYKHNRRKALQHEHLTHEQRAALLGWYMLHPKMF
jgi:hypothetical protein